MFLPCLEMMQKWAVCLWEIRRKQTLTLKIYSECYSSPKPVFAFGKEKWKQNIRLHFLHHFGPDLPQLRPFTACWVSDIQSHRSHYSSQGCCCDVTEPEEVPSGSGVGRGQYENCICSGLWPLQTPHLDFKRSHTAKQTLLPGPQ